jgi:hypothetical protein
MHELELEDRGPIWGREDFFILRGPGGGMQCFLGPTGTPQHFLLAHDMSVSV